MLILLLSFLPAEVLTAVAALLDFFKTCIIGYAAALLFLCRHKTHQLSVLFISQGIVGCWYIIYFSSLSAYHWHLIIYQVMQKIYPVFSSVKKVSFKRVKYSNNDAILFFMVYISSCGDSERFK